MAKEAKKISTAKPSIDDRIEKAVAAGLKAAEKKPAKSPVPPIAQPSEPLKQDPLFVRKDEPKQPLRSDPPVDTKPTVGTGEGLAALAVVALILGGIYLYQNTPTAPGVTPPAQQTTNTSPPAVKQQTAPASTTGPLFELGGVKPGADAMRLADSQGYTWKKGVPGQDGCALAAGRCPNLWVKK